jgi:hypothetical protein
LGLLIGILGGLAIALIVASTTNIWGQTDQTWLYRWQTLLTGILALAGALLTVHMIERQVRQMDKAEQERVQRKAIAARALLPSALASLSDYAETCTAELRKIYAMTSAEELGDSKAPAPDKESLSVLSSCVEWDDNLRKPLLDLTARLQVQQSRLQGMVFNERRVNIWGTTMVGPTVAQYLIDALDLHVRCGVLFAYARGQDTAAPQDVPYREDMQKAATRFALRPEAFANLFLLIEQRYEQRPAPVTPAL